MTPWKFLGVNVDLFLSPSPSLKLWVPHATFPTEIYHLIFENLQGSQVDLANLCLVCSSFRDTAERFLYCEVHVDEERLLNFCDVVRRWCTASRIRVLHCRIKGDFPKDDVRVVAMALQKAVNLHELDITVLGPNLNPATILSGCRFRLKRFHSSWALHQILGFIKTQPYLQHWGCNSVCKSADKIHFPTALLPNLASIDVVGIGGIYYSGRRLRLTRFRTQLDISHDATVDKIVYFLQSVGSTVTSLGISLTPPRISWRSQYNFERIVSKTPALVFLRVFDSSPLVSPYYLIHSAQKHANSH